MFFLAGGFGAYLSIYLGVYKGVDITRAEMGPYTTVYLENIGPYHKVNKQIEKVEKYMASQGAPCTRTFGEYIDDPAHVEEARLRSHVGCLVESVPENLPEGLHTKTIPRAHYTIAVFSGSPGIGPLKVYPKVYDFMEAQKIKISGPLIEIYEIHSITEKNAMTTTYLFPYESLETSLETHE